MSELNVHKCSLCDCEASRLTFGKTYCKYHSDEVFNETVRLTKLNNKNTEVKKDE
jgi:hypothetical protein